MDEQKVRFYISDYQWFFDIDVALNNTYTDDNKEIKKFIENIQFLSKKNAHIIKEQVDAFDINNKYTDNIDMILWGSPHWACSSHTTSEDMSFVDDERNPTCSYIMEESIDGKKPKINFNYDNTKNKPIKYESHSEYKGGIIHYLINKYKENKIIVIPFCDNIPELFYKEYDNIATSPYQGVIYYCYINTPGYIPSASHEITKRCDAEEIGALIYIPNEYIDLLKKCVIEWWKDKPYRINLYEFMKRLYTENKNFLFLGEHICNLSKHAVEYIIS